MVNLKTRILLLICALIAGIFIPREALAIVRIDELSVSAWPEYDDPRVLVIYYGSLSKDTPIPSEVTFLIPGEAQLGMTCSITDQNEHKMVMSDRSPVDDKYVRVSFTTTERNFHLEYYIDALKKDGDARSFSIPVKSVIEVDSLTLEAQEPRGAQDFVFQNSIVHTGGDGLNYYVRDVGALPAGGEAFINVSYTKKGDALSVAGGMTTGGSGGEGSSNMGGPKTASAPRGMASLVFALVLGAIVAFLIFSYLGRKPHVEFARNAVRNATSGVKGKENTPPSVSQGEKMHRASRDSGSPRSAPASHPRFCTQCGAKLNQGDRFCTHCGYQVKAS